MQWQYCQFSMYFFQINQNSTIYTDLIAIRHLQCQNQPFVSYLLAEDSGPSIPNIVAILPYFDGFLPNLSKLNYLHRWNRHPTLQCQNLSFQALSPTCSLRTKRSRSQCCGNIASFRCISSNLIKTRLFIQT